MNTNTYFNPSLDSTVHLSVFLKNVFKQLGCELEQLQERFYKGEEKEKVFDQNEQSWVGLLNNAIIKSYVDSAVTLIESCSYPEKSFTGRADLIASLQLSNATFNFIFEAKQYIENDKKNLLEDSPGEFEKFMQQGAKYYSLNDYKGQKTYIVPILFGRLISKEFLDRASEFFGDMNKYNGDSDFCILYSEENSGLWIYGKLFDAYTRKSIF